MKRNIFYESKKDRFSLRKIKIGGVGLASVLLGSLLFGIGLGNQPTIVHAAKTTESQNAENNGKKTTVDSDQKTTKPTTAQVSAPEQTESTANTAKDQDNKVVNQNGTEQQPVVKTGKSEADNPSTNKVDSQEGVANDKGATAEQKLAQKATNLSNSSVANVSKNVNSQVKQGPAVQTGKTNTQISIANKNKTTESNSIAKDTSSKPASSETLTVKNSIKPVQQDSTASHLQKQIDDFNTSVKNSDSFKNADQTKQDAILKAISDAQNLLNTYSKQKTAELLATDLTQVAKNDFSKNKANNTLTIDPKKLANAGNNLKSLLNSLDLNLTTTYAFVDDDDDGMPVGDNVIVNGNANQKGVATNLKVPANYVLATGTSTATDIYNKLPSTVDFGTSSLGTIFIHLKQNKSKITDVHLNDPNAKVQRTYKVYEKFPDGSTKLLFSLDGTFYKTAIKDSNGHVTYGRFFEDPVGAQGKAPDQWNNYTWRDQNDNVVANGYDPTQLPLSVTIDQKAGYSIDQSPQNIGPIHFLKTYDSNNNLIKLGVDMFLGGDPQTVMPDSRSFFITYKANPQSVKINFVDDDESGATVTPSSPVTLTGVTDGNADFTQMTVSTNYIVAGTPSYKFTADDNQSYTVHLKHATQTAVTNTTSAQYRVIEKLPDGSKKVLIDLTATYNKVKTTDAVTKAVISENYSDANITYQHNDKDDHCFWDDTSFAYASMDQFTGYTVHIPSYDSSEKDSAGNSVLKIYQDKDASGASIIRLDSIVGGGVTFSAVPASKDVYITYTAPVTYKFVDDDENETQVGSDHVVTNESTHKTTDSTSADYTIVNTDLTIPKNYELDTGKASDSSTDIYNTLPLQVDLGLNHSNIINIHLKHKTEEVKSTPEHRIYHLIEKLPNGTNKTLVTVEADFYKTNNKDLVTGKIISYGTIFHDPSGGGNDNLNIYNWYGNGSDSDKTESKWLNLDSQPGYTLVMPDDDAPIHFSKGTATTGGLTTQIDIFWGSETVSQMPDSHDFYITYTPHKQKGTIYYISTVTGDNGKIVSSQDTAGVSDESKDISLNLPDGWVIDTNAQNSHAQDGFTLATDGKSAEATFDHVDGTNQSWNVYIKHGTKTVSEGKKGDIIPGTTSQKFVDDVDKTKLIRDVTRTINYTVPDVKKSDGTSKYAAIPSVVQTVTFTRLAHVDMVTGKVTYDDNDWQVKNSTPDYFDVQNIQQIPGYVAKATDGAGNSIVLNAQGQIPKSDTISANSEDESINISYTPVKQTVQVKYVDENILDAQGKPTVIGSDSFSGNTDTTGQYQPVSPDESKYDLENSQKISHTFEATNTPIIIKLVQKVAEDTENKSIARTITILVPDVLNDNGTPKYSGNNTITQTVTGKRTKYTNLVTGNVYYGNWTLTGSFDAVTLPNIPGYTVQTNGHDDLLSLDKKQIKSADTPSSSYSSGASDVYTDAKGNKYSKSGKSKLDDWVDPEIKITYKANKQQVKYQFVDDNNSGANVGSVIEVDGHTDEAVNPSTKVTVPAGYQLATGQSIPTSYKFGSISPKDNILIHLVHGNKEIKPSDVPAPGNEIPGDNDHKKPGDGTPKNDITYNDLHKAITETVHYTGAANDKNPADNVQTVNYKRTATIDNVTGDVNYSNWTIVKDGKNFASVTTPTVAGYNPDKNNVAAYAPSNDDITAGKNSDVTVTYSANPQSETIKFVDDDNKDAQGHPTEVGADHVLSGVTDQQVNTNLTKPAVYDLANGNSIPDKYTFKASGNAPITIHLTHHIDKGISSDNNANDKFSETITRTITAHEPQADGSFKDVDLSQSGTLTRTGDYDEVAGKVTKWNDWTTHDFDAVNAPKLEGYTPDKSTIAAVTGATDGYVDPKIVINYTADQRNAIYNFVDEDENGKAVGSDTVSGVTNQKNVKVDLTKDVPDGYEVDGTLPTSIDFGTKDPEAVTIKLKHVKSPVISKPVKPTDVIPGTKNKTYPDDLTKDENFEHDVTRTVTINYPAGADTQTQKVHFTRTATVDAVTGAISYGNWTTNKDSFDEVDAKVVDGYVADKAKADQVTGVKESDPDSNVTINYTKVGSYVPVTSDGKPVPNTGKTPYTNDPKDPTKVETTVPDVPGYTPKNGATQKPANPTKDTNVVYTPNDENQTIEYVDKDGNVIYTDKLSGKMDSSTDYTEHNQNGHGLDGWKLAAGQSVPSSITFKSSDTPIKITIDHDTEVINQDAKKGDAISGTDHTIAQDVQAQKQIVVNYEENISASDRHNNATDLLVHRNVTIDKVTGQIVGQPADWTAYGIKNYDGKTGKWGNATSNTSLTIPAYTPEGQKQIQDGYKVFVIAPDGSTIGSLKNPLKPGDQVPAIILTQDMINNWDNNKEQYRVQYYPAQMSINYQFVDDDNKGDNVGLVIKVSGNTDDTVNPSKKVIIPDGYKLANGQTISTSERLNNENPLLGTTVSIHLKHVISPVIKPGKGNQPKPGDVISGTTGKKYPTDMPKDSDLEHDVTRTIHYTGAGEDTPKDVVQTIHFERTATVDAINGKVSYTDWVEKDDKKDSFDEVDTKVVNGYVADKAKANQVTGIKESDPDSSVTINYTKVGSYVPTDENGNPISGVDPVPYINDPKDPTKVKTTVPDIPGYTPTNGPTSVPADPTKDTNVAYIPIPSDNNNPGGQQGNPVVPDNSNSVIPNNGTESNNQNTSGNKAPTTDDDLIVAPQKLAIYDKPNGKLLKNVKYINNEVKPMAQRVVDGQLWYEIANGEWIAAAGTRQKNENPVEQVTSTKGWIRILINKVMIYDAANGKFTGQYMSLNDRAKVLAVAGKKGQQWYKIDDNKWIIAAGSKLTKNLHATTIRLRDAKIYDRPGHRVIKKVAYGTHFKVRDVAIRNKQIWYKVGKGKWVNEKDIVFDNSYVHQFAAKGLVKVSPKRAYYYDINGHKQTHFTKRGTVHKVVAKAIINGKICYRVGNQYQWLPASQVKHIR